MLLLGVWLFTVGLWPFMDTGHKGRSLPVVADLATHVVGGVIIVNEYRRIRRHNNG